MDASGAWLAFVRGFNDSLLGHTSIAKGETLHVLYAAGSLAPSTCTEDFDMTMIHNIGHGSAAVPALALGSGTIAAELADPITPEHQRRRTPQHPRPFATAAAKDEDGGHGGVLQARPRAGCACGAAPGHRQELHGAAADDPLGGKLSCKRRRDLHRVR